MRVNRQGWRLNGKVNQSLEHDEDIVSMWEEPRPRVQLDLPAPLKEPQEGMYFIENGVIHKSLFTKSNQNYSEEALENGFYFATKEDAQEWLDAMRGARR